MLLYREPLVPRDLMSCLLACATSASPDVPQVPTPDAVTPVPLPHTGVDLNLCVSCLHPGTGHRQLRSWYVLCCAALLHLPYTVHMFCLAVGCCAYCIPCLHPGTGHRQLGSWYALCCATETCLPYTVQPFFLVS